MSHKAPRDPNTLSNYNDLRSVHTIANFTIDFSKEKLSGTISLTLEVVGENANEIVLDTSFLDVKHVRLDGSPADFALSSRTEPYGSALKIQTEGCKPCPKPGESLNLEV